MSEKQTKKRLVTCLFIALLMISTFSVLFKVPNVLQTVHAQGAGASVTLVQGPAQGTASILSGTFTVTVGSTPTSGNTLILCYLGAAYTTNPSITGVSETGVTWTKAIAENGWGDVEIWYGNVGASAGTVITITVSGGVGSTFYGEVADVCEWSGLSGSPVDQTAYFSGGSESTIPTGTTSATTQANELIIGLTGGFQNINENQGSPTNGFTLLDGISQTLVNYGFSLAYLYNIVSATGAQSSSTTVSGTVDAVGCIATFSTTSSPPTLINSFYYMSGASNPISGNPTDQHGFDVVHTTDIVQCNMAVDGATRTYLAYDSGFGGNNINLYYSNSITGTWTAYSGNPILSGTGDFRTPSVVFVSGIFYMFLNNINDKDVELWTSTNGITFTETGTVLTTAYDEWTSPFVWLNPNNNLWYLFWTQGDDSGGWWETMARSSSTITGLSSATDTVVMNVTTPYNNAFPTIMYTNGEYWLLTEAETSDSYGLWRVNAWYSTSVTSGYSLANNSPILTNDEACPQIFMTANNAACYLFTNQNQTSNQWYQEIRTVYTPTVNGAPTVSVSPTSWTMDVGQSKIFSATASGGSGSYTSYQWYVGGVAQSGTASTFSYSPVSSGSYLITVMVTDSSGATSAQSSAATVTVAASPTVSIVPVGPLTLDVGQVQTFTATASGGSGAINYHWYLDGAAVGSNSASYSYTASGTSHSVICSVTDSASTPVTSPVSNAVSVTVNSALAAPTVSVSPTSWIMDVGQSKTFSASASGGSGFYTSYQWYVGGSAQSGATASTFSFVPGSSGSYSVTVTVTDSSGATSAQSSSATVKVNSALVAPTASASKSTVDQGQTSSLTSTAVSTGTSPYTYQWLQKAPGGSFLLISGAASNSYNFVTSVSTATGTWSFELQVTDSASTPVVVTSTAASVTVNVAPTVSVSPGSATLDVGQSKTFTAAPAGGSGTYTSYQWYVNGVAQSGKTASTFSFAPKSSGSYSVTVTVTDSSGATSAQSSSATVKVNAAPTVTVSPTSWTMNVGQSKTFTAAPAGGSGTYTSYQWYVNGVAQSGKTASTFSFAPKSSGSYSVTVTVTDSSGATSARSSAATVKVLR